MNYPVAMTTPELAKIFRGVSALPTTFVHRSRRQARAAPRRHAESGADGARGAGARRPQYRTHESNASTIRRTPCSTTPRRRRRFPASTCRRCQPAQRTAAIKALNAEDCTCGCGLTLAACRINDPDLRRQPADRPEDRRENRGRALTPPTKSFTTEDTGKTRAGFCLRASVTSVVFFLACYAIKCATASTIASASMPYARYRSGMSPDWPKRSTPSGIMR